MAGSNLSKNVVIALALAGALALVITRRVVPYLVDRATYTDGQRVWTTTRGEGLRYAVWKPAEPLGGDINTPARETRPALSSDGRWLVFGVGEEGQNADLYVARVLNGVPGPARPLARVNSEADEIAPSFGPDALYFASNRRGGAGGFDLYRAAWDGEEFGAPEALPEAINTGADEVDPAAFGSPLPDSSAGRSGEPAPGAVRGELYFASNRADGGRGDFDLFVAAFDDVAGRMVVEPLAALCSPGEDREPGLTADGRTLFFATDRDAGGDFDLWKSFREQDRWLAPRRLEGLNTPDSERGPGPSSDGFALFFQRESAAVPADLLRAESVELFRLPAKPAGWADLALLAALLLLAALAWMAKRWEQLDVLYKCFLVSLLVHLILMWLLRGVHPEADPLPTTPGREATFKVRVLRDASELSALRERGGTLESERAALELAAAPPRLESTGEPAAAPAPERATLARSASQPPAAPARQPAEVQPSSSADSPPAPRLADAAAPVPLRSASAPVLEVRARTDPRSARRALAADSSAAQRVPERSSGPALEPAPPSTPASVSVARVESRESAVTRFETAAVAPAARGVTDRAGPALVQPSEPNERRSVGEAGTRLPEPRAFAATERELDVSAPGLVQARAGEAAAAGEGLASGAAPTPAAAGLVARRPVGAAPSAPAFQPSAREPARASAAGAGPELEVPVAEPVARASTAAPEVADLALPAPTGFSPRERGADRGREGPVAPARASALLAAPVSVAEAAPRPSPVAIELERPARGRDLPRSAQPAQATPYRSRFGSEKEVALETFGGGADTERAVLDGLAYLAGRQRSTGHWADAQDRDAKYRDVRVGNTGLCLLAFLGAGHTPDSGTRFSETTRRAVDYLLSTQNRRNGHFGDTSSYGHGVATYALAECFALTKAERLRAPLERAVAHVLSQQFSSTRGGDERLIGGWGYYYGDGSRYDSWPRVSITSWQVMALESARLGGLAVDDGALLAAGRFIAGSWDARLGALRYSHDPRRLNSGYPTLPGSTPAGLFALSLLGQDVSEPRFSAPREYVMRRAPRGWRYAGEEAFVESAQGNVYFLYYGSLAMLRAGGDDWRRWNIALKETLLPSQESDGSWRPLDVYSRYAGDTREDSVYTTAMCVLTLEVYYRYFTPLLQRE